MKADSYIVNHPGGSFSSGSYRVWKEGEGRYYYRGNYGDIALTFDPINVIVADQTRAWTLPRREWSEYFPNRFEPILRSGEMSDPGVLFVGMSDIKYMSFGVPEWGEIKLWGDEFGCTTSCSATVELSGECGLELSEGMIYSIGDQEVNFVKNDPCDCVQLTINGMTPPVFVNDGELVDVQFDFLCQVDGVVGPICTNVIPLQMNILEGNKVSFHVG